MSAGAKVKEIAYQGPACPHCRASLNLGPIVSGRVSCPRCNRKFEALRLDPAPLAADLVRVAEAGPSGATPCVHHQGNASVATCGRCGIFMCGLCRVEVDGLVLCSECFDRLWKGLELPSAWVDFSDAGRIARVLLLLGLLGVILGVVTGPAAIYFTFKSARQRRGMGRPPGWLRLAAFVSAGVLETVAAVAIFVWLIHSASA